MKAKAAAAHRCLEEQEQLGKSERFWNLIAERRRQPTLSRSELGKRLDEALSGARD